MGEIIFIDDDPQRANDEVINVHRPVELEEKIVLTARGKKKKSFGLSGCRAGSSRVFSSWKRGEIEGGGDRGGEGRRGGEKARGRKRERERGKEGERRLVGEQRECWRRE